MGDVKNLVIRAAAIGSAAVLVLLAVLLLLGRGSSSDPAEPSALSPATGEAWMAVGMLALVLLAVAVVAALVVRRSRR